MRGHYKVIVYVRSRLRGLVSHCKKRKLRLDLQFDDVWNALVEENGTELVVHKNRKLERRDRTLGFTKDNLVVLTRKKQEA